MPAAARLGDPTAHAGLIVGGCATVKIGRLPAARLGDPHTCPIHGGGVVITASSTVQIGYAFAARVGDLCGCGAVGTPGIGVPSVIGPETVVASPKPAKDLAFAAGPGGGAQDQPWSESDKKAPAVVFHAEGSISDADKDGSYDSAKFDAAMIHMRNQGEVDVGPVELGGSHSLDAFYAHREVSSSANVGSSLSTSAEAGFKKQGADVFFGPAGDNGANPYLSVGGEYQLLSAEASVTSLVGDDGRRIGYKMEAKASAQVASGEVHATRTVRIPFTSWTIETKAAVSGGVGDVGAGAGMGVYWDRGDERFHLEGMLDIGAILKAGLDVEISIGKARAPSSPAPGGSMGQGAGGIPNAIVAGEPTVMIG